MLKQKLRQAESLILKNDDDIIELKRSISATKLNECNIQLKLSEVECIRLRNIIDNLVSSKDENESLKVRELKEETSKQSLNIAKLEKDKLDLSSKIHQYSFDNEKLKEKLKSFESKLLKELINNISKQNLITITCKEKIERINQRLSLVLEKLKRCYEHITMLKVMKEELEIEKKKVNDYTLSLEHANQDLQDKNEVIKAKSKALDKQEEIRLRLIKENEELKAIITLGSFLL